MATNLLNRIPAGHAISTSLVGNGVEWWENGEIVGDNLTADLATLIADARIEAGLDTEAWWA